MKDIKSITFFMGECKRMKLDVLGPDINESYYKFAVNKDNAIRFGMGAIKGVGASAVNAIVSERKSNGNYKSIFDLSKRVDLRACNKKALDSLASAGAFDCFNSIHRAQYFYDTGDGITFIEKIIKYGGKFQANKNSAQVSLFTNSDVEQSELEIPDSNQWDTIEKLAREREVIGIYISGHPLDDFKVEMESFCNANVSMFKSPKEFVGNELTIAGVITELEHRVSRQGKGWASFTLEDYVDSYEFRIFGEDYLKFKHFIILNNFIHIKTAVVEGWKNKETGIIGDPRIQFKNFKLLQDVVKSFARRLSIQLNLDDIKENKIKEIKQLLVNHKGDHNLTFVVYDQEEKIKIDMQTNKHKINISPELLELLDQQKIYYKLN